MTTRRQLRGVELRYAITDHLFRHGPQTVAVLIEELNHQGFAIAGRPSKTISDALRWEVAHGRVNRLRHGLYGPASMPRSTENRIHRRMMALHAEVDAATRHDDEKFWDRLWGPTGDL